MEKIPNSQEKITVEVNKEKLQELIDLAQEPLELDPSGKTIDRAEALAREAFGGYSVGIKDNTRHFALYNGTECVGASIPETEWYNPNIDWESVKQAVNAIWTITEKMNGNVPGSVFER